MTQGDHLLEQLQDEGWTVDQEALATLDTDLNIDNAKAISALMNPFRIRLMSSLSREPESVKELSVRFEVPATRLYHHLGLMQEHGAVRVVGTRRSGARTERCYAAVRGGIAPDPGLLENHPDEMAESAVKMVSLAGEAFGAAMRAGRITMTDPENSEGTLIWTAPRLTKQQHSKIAGELKDLATRIAELSAQNRADAVPDCEATIILLLATPDVTVPN